MKRLAVSDWSALPEFRSSLRSGTRLPSQSSVTRIFQRSGSWIHSLVACYINAGSIIND